MRHFRQTTSFWLIAQALCFCLLLQGSGIAEALPLPPKQALLTESELARLESDQRDLRETASAGLLARFVDRVRSSAGEAASAVTDWLAGSGAEAPIRVAQSGGTLPLPPRLMAAFLASSGRGQATPPSPPGFATDGSKPPAELAGLVQKAATDEIPLLAGFNLISIPEEPADPDPAAVLNPIGGLYNRAFAYDACDVTDPWKVYDPADPAASDLTAIDHKIGLWLDATAATDLPSDGVLPATTALNLCVGWNLIGFPAAQPRHPLAALAPIAGKWQRIFGYDVFDPVDPWEVYSVGAPEWANDLSVMQPGRGYWILITESTTLEIRNQGPPPTVAISSPADLDVVTEPTPIIGTVDSDLLESWTLTYRPIGDGDPVTLATGNAPILGDSLATFDPTLLLNGLYEFELTATDVQGQQVTDQIAIVVEGNMKIGHFTLSFLDLAVPVSGLDIEIVRTYDSRDKKQRDFGVGWRLDIRQGSYRNNRPSGDGWQFQTGFLPCDTVRESKSHLAVVRLSDREVYRFAFRLVDGAPTLGGCFATASFDYIDGPLPGSTLEILGNDEVFWENGSDQVIDVDTFGLYEPQDVRLTTRDGRIFDLDLNDGVTRLEDLNGNQLSITAAGITHTSGRGIEFLRDSAGRINRITDPSGGRLEYSPNNAGDLVAVTDPEDNVTSFVYEADHRLLEIIDPLGRRPVRNDYDTDGRLVSSTDAFGNTMEIAHNLENRQEVVTDRLGNTQLLEYDARGNVIRTTDVLGRVITRTFDGRDRLLTDTDPLGHTTTRTYDPEGNVSSFTDPLGNVSTFTYNSRGQVLSTTDARGGVTTNTYDGLGNLLSTVNALGHATTWSYDARGDRLTETDPLGNVATFAHDAAGNLTRRVDRLGAETTLTYGASGSLLTRSVTRTTPTGVETLTTSYSYDALGRQVASTDFLGNTSTVSFDAVGSVVRSVDVLGRETRFNHGPAGRLISTTYPDGSTEAQTYDAEGRIITRTDRAGRVTNIAYDAAGHVTEQTLPDGTTSRNTHDAAGRLIAITDARGNTTSFEYDAAGRRIRVVNALGQEMTFGYDANGNRTSMTDARGQTTTYEYDILNRRVRTVFPDGSEQTETFDSLGRRVSETDQAGRATAFAYDAEGRLTSVTDALGQVTSYAYDELGNRVSQTDAAGRATFFEYDALGRQTKRTLPPAGTPSETVSETMAHDASGNRVSWTRFDGSTVQYAYDALGRLASRSFPDGTTVAWTFTATGQQATATDARGTTIYAYDLRDRLTSLVYPDGRALSYTYDALGNRSSITAQIEGTILTTAYTYDAINRLVKVTDPDGREYNHTYDANGNRATLAYPNGVNTTYAYDALNRLIGLSTETGVGEAVQSYAYTLGPDGHRTRIDETGGRSHEYTYDALYRLTTERVNDASNLFYENSFTYDVVGNRLSEDHLDSDGITTSNIYIYDPRDRISNAGSDGFTWDDNGGLLSRSGAVGASYTWDFEGRLVRVDLADGTTVEHDYDGNGNRVRTRVTPVGGATEVTDYLVDTSSSLSQVIAESDSGGSVTAYYVRGNELLAALRPAGTRFFHADGLGSVRRLTDEAGLVTDTYDYSAFGELLEHTGTDPNAYLFVGEQLDPNAHFYYLRARWMDPQLGRFASFDRFSGIASEPRSLHKYLYAENDPVNRVDPSGFLSAVNVTFASMIVGLVASAALGAYWHHIAITNFPNDLLTTPPDAYLVGFQWSISAGRLIRQLRHPVTKGLSLGLAFTGLAASLEVVIPTRNPTQAWVYAALGGYVGLSIDRGPFGKVPSLYAGAAWHVPNAAAYAGASFCSSFNSSAVSKKIGIPVNACTGRQEPGGPVPAATVTLNRFNKYGALVSSRMQYYFLDNVHMDRLISPPSSLDQLEPWARSLIQDVP